MINVKIIIKKILFIVFKSVIDLIKKYIKILYFKYCLDYHDLASIFVLKFVPQDLRGSNPHFFIKSIDEKICNKNIIIKVNMDKQPYELMFFGDMDARNKRMSK